MLGRATWNLSPIRTKPPFEIIGIDVTGPLSETKRGNKYIIVAIDYFSKFCISKATSDCTALTTAKFIFDDMLLFDDCGCGDGGWW